MCHPTCRTSIGKGGGGKKHTETKRAFFTTTKKQTKGCRLPPQTLAPKPSPHCTHTHCAATTTTSSHCAAARPLSQQQQPARLFATNIKSPPRLALLRPRVEKRAAENKPPPLLASPRPPQSSRNWCHGVPGENGRGGRAMRVDLTTHTDPKPISVVRHPPQRMPPSVAFSALQSLLPTAAGRQGQSRPRVRQAVCSAGGRRRHAGRQAGQPAKGRARPAPAVPGTRGDTGWHAAPHSPHACLPRASLVARSGHAVPSHPERSA